MAVGVADGLMVTDGVGVADEVAFGVRVGVGSCGDGVGEEVWVRNTRVCV